MENLSKVNVAPTSDNGHYVLGAKQVINLDDITETFDVIGSSILTTKNHQNLELKEDCTILCQQVYNPLTRLLERSKD